MTDKYQKEIEDILKKAEAEEPLPRTNSNRSLRSLVSQYVRQSMNNKVWGISPGKIMLATLAVFLASLLLRPIMPGIFGLILWGCLIVFILAYGLFFVKPSKPPNQRKMWRGQYIDDEPSSFFDSLKGKFRRRSK